MAKPAKLLATVVLFGFSVISEGALIPAGNGLVNDSDIGVTWLQDANAFFSLSGSGQSSAQAAQLINDIKAAVPTIPDGITRHTVTNSDFSGDRMTWWGAQAWVGYLNNINYKGLSTWRLPTSFLDKSLFWPCSGYNCTSSDLGHLFYSELGGRSRESITTTHNETYGLVSGVQNYLYWSGTPYEPLHSYAWQFDMQTGYQFASLREQPLYVWAVADGQAAVVPAPAAVWLLSSALAALLGVGRRQQHA